MKWKSWAVIAIAVFTVACCGRHAKLPDGWYLLGAGSSEVLTPAIVTVHDFASLRVDSLSEAQGSFRYRITGQLNEEGTGRFARATEKAIGSRIAFLCDGRVVCTPAVHARIEDGNFLIVLEDDPGGVRTRRIYARLEAAMHGKRE